MGLRVVDDLYGASRADLGARAAFGTELRVNYIGIALGDGPFRALRKADAAGNAFLEYMVRHRGILFCNCRILLCFPAIQRRVSLFCRAGIDPSP